MARIDNLTNFITDIAAAIKAKTGKTDPITPANFDTEINDIEASGEDIGEYYTDGLTNGGSAYPGICKSIKKVPADLINITDSNKSAQYLFAYCGNLEETPTINMTNITSMNSMYYQCHKLKKIPAMDTSSVTGMYNMCYFCGELTDVGMLDASSVTLISGAFGACSKLTNFGGIKDLGKAYLPDKGEYYNSYSLGLSDCTQLTHDSLMNVINNLYDIASAGCPKQKVVIGSANLAKLTEEEIAIATNKGWSVVADYDDV